MGRRRHDRVGEWGWTERPHDENGGIAAGPDDGLATVRLAWTCCGPVRICNIDFPFGLDAAMSVRRPEWNGSAVDWARPVRLY